MRWTLLSALLVLLSSTFYRNYPNQIAIPGVRSATVPDDQSSAQRSPSKRSIAEGEGLPPYLPTETDADAGNSIRWGISMAKLFSNRDSIWFVCDLINNSDRRIVFTIKNRPMIEFTPTGKKSIRVQLSDGAALRTWFYDRAPEPSKRILRFRADLRELVGRLSPGEYRLKLAWPSSGYSIEGLPGYDPKELISPEWTFKVLETDLASASKGIPQWRLMIKREDPPNPLTAGNLPRGVFTNTLKQPCEIPYYPVGVHGELTRPPLSVPLSLARRVGENGGGAIVAFPAPQDLPMWKLRPGESVEITLPDWKTDGDGIYDYMLNVYIGKGKTRSLEDAVSEPFDVDGSTAKKN